MGIALQLRSAATGHAVVPSAAVLGLATRGKSPTTWNRYASTLVRWEGYAALKGTSFLPADPAHFANFLAEAAEGSSGHTQTKHRVCAIDALSALARVPSPAADSLVRDVRAGLHRSLRGTRGRARPIFSYKNVDLDFRGITGIGVFAFGTLLLARSFVPGRGTQARRHEQGARARQGSRRFRKHEARRGRRRRGHGAVAASSDAAPPRGSESGLGPV